MVTSALSSRLSHGSRLLVIAQHADESIRESGMVADFNEKSFDTVIDDRFDVPDARRHDRPSCGHRFERGRRHAFTRRRQRQHTGGSELDRHIHHMTSKGHVGVQTERGDLVDQSRTLEWVAAAHQT